jgi:hypothetical protein
VFFVVGRVLMAAPLNFLMGFEQFLDMEIIAGSMDLSIVLDGIEQDQ